MNEAIASAGPGHSRLRAAAAESSSRAFVIEFLNMTIRRHARFGVLATILALALVIRLHGIGFGLPSLYDPDEPIFMVLALKLLKDQTLNPGWFGHPGTTTIYLIALIDAAVLGGGLITHQFGSVRDFAMAAYADPGLLFIPGRVAMALFGVGCVWLTWSIGRRLFGWTTGLIAAGLLAINSLHVMWSQVIRTDVMASFFMLAALLFSIRAAQRGRIVDYIASGCFIGIAIATKWPSAIVATTLIGAALFGWLADRRSPSIEARNLAAGLAAILVALFLASPYIFLDWQTVLANVGSEVRPRHHLAQTGEGFLYNLRWYLLGQVASSMGLAGLILAVAGGAVAWVRNPVARWTLLPLTAAFLALIFSQHLVWSRWLVPGIPLLCLLIAVTTQAIGGFLAARLGSGRLLLTGLVAAAVAVPSIASVRDKVRERATDTRALAAKWAAAHIPPGSTVVLENLELRLRNEPWRFLFPFGKTGCIDGLQTLAKGVSYGGLEKARKGTPIVDLGNVDPEKLDSCRGDYAILTYFDLYVTERSHFPAEVGNYRTLLSGGRTLALFRPVPGSIGGPVVRIVALSPHPYEN
jgi:hypothetical protein